MPQISVIVPVYKVELYLRRCIDSILSQTFTDFELILVDDGSPDNCPAICDEYALKDNRIHVIHQKNGGLSAARNAGIDYVLANSDSEWISFVDSDDWVHPNYLEYLFRAVLKTKTNISVCGVRRVEKEEKSSTVSFCVVTKPWDQLYLESWIHGVVAWNKLYNKELFIGLRYPIGKIHEDEYLTYKLLARAGIISFVNADLYFYFQNPGGIIKSGYSLAKLNIIPALKEQCKFAKKNGLTDLYLDKRQTLLVKILEQINLCKEAKNLSKNEQNQGMRYLRRELRKYLFFEREYIAQIDSKKWYYELAYPNIMWFYWTCVGITGKIKKAIRRNV
ncbi:MAG: glycosyltransferase family 2 protein [Erysipelotrichaceae bacterium]|nr:glycosyltransferase family 2 protein [Clostridia bacterium]MBQ6217770.1 glycosyltransferase family 2 protein [Erysipelotrichaceae bacterium]